MAVTRHPASEPAAAPADSGPGPAPRPRRRRRYPAAENRAAYVFLLPWLVGLLGLTAGPLVVSLYLSFTDYDLFTSPHWVGLHNYTRMFTDDPRFLHALKVTLIYVVCTVPLQLGFALFIAVLLNRRLRGIGWYRAIYYLPSLLGGSVAVAVMWRQVFGGDGVFNKFLALFGVHAPNWVSTPQYSLYTLVLLHVWQFGSPMVLFLAGLKQIPRELYEAAAIDGAGRFKQFTQVTLPMLTPIIFFNLVLQVIQSFQAFTPAFIVSGGTGGPSDSTLFYTLYLYQQGFTNFKMGYASAMAWVLLVIIAAFTAVNFRMSKHWVFYRDERA
ncbi:MAG TPA: sugar ABC transporter permease [Spirillospora sp.]|nr:sugar ABC transporter permease [Spirillospora sp.]